MSGLRIDKLSVINALSFEKIEFPSSHNNLHLRRSFSLLFALTDRAFYSPAISWDQGF